jgi:hypothetical protein
MIGQHQIEEGDAGSFFQFNKFIQRNRLALNPVNDLFDGSDVASVTFSHQHLSDDLRVASAALVARASLFQFLAQCVREREAFWSAARIARLVRLPRFQISVICHFSVLSLFSVECVLTSIVALVSTTGEAITLVPVTKIACEAGGGQTLTVVAISVSNLVSQDSLETGSPERYLVCGSVDPNNGSNSRNTWPLLAPHCSRWQRSFHLSVSAGRKPLLD